MNAQAAAAAPALYSLAMKRTFNAPRETVFRAWTDADLLAKWFGPAGVTVSGAEIDLKTGGAYRIAMVLPDGSDVVHHGHYREIDPPARLVFTWLLEGQACAGSGNPSGETVVTVTLRDADGRTELTLTHEMLPSETARDNHERGWTGCLDGLAAMLG
jgi:uncharacterized protein YndB with AHSA1/START domain